MFTSTRKKLTKIIFLITTMFLSLMFLACGAFWLHDYIEDFDAFLLALNRGNVGVIEIDLQIEGFRPIVDTYFNFGLPFSSGSSYTFANIGKASFNVIVREDGTLFYSYKDLLNKDIRYNKFVSEENGYFSVRDIFDREIVALPSLVKEVSILDNKSIIVDGAVLDFYLNPLKVEGYPNFTVVSAIDNLGFRIVYYNGLFGFANLASNKIIYPRFYRVSGFNKHGFAAANLICGKYVIVDNEGDIVLEQQNGKLPVNYDGEFLTFLYVARGNLFGVGDSNFNLVTNRLFTSIYGNSVWGGDIIIYNAPHVAQRFYSINASGFLLGYYDSIVAVDNFFIARNLDERFSLYTCTLINIISDKQFICFNGVILTVRYRNRIFYFCTKDNQKNL